jgi:hypothetical protein
MLLKLFSIISMKTDALYLNLFKIAPILALRMAGVNVPRANEYTCSSEELKKTFRIDALFTPPSPELPLLIAEVQFQKNAEIYDRIVASFAIKRLESSGVAEIRFTGMRMAIFFATRSIDTGATVYEPLVRSGLLRIVYLDEATLGMDTSDLSVEELVSLLLVRLTVSPKDEVQDRAMVEMLARNVATMRDVGEQEEFQELFVDLFHSKYKYLTKEEIRAMLIDTATYLDIFHDIGESRAVQQYAEELCSKGSFGNKFG